MRGRYYFQYFPVIFITSLFFIIIFHLITLYPLTYGIDGGYYAFVIEEIQKGNINLLFKYPVSFGIFYVFSIVFGNISLGIKISSLVFLIITSILIPLLISEDSYKNILEFSLIIIASLSSWGGISLLNGFYKQIIALPFLILSLYNLNKFLNNRKIKNFLLFLLFLVLCYFSHIPIFLLLVLNVIMFLILIPFLKETNEEKHNIRLNELYRYILPVITIIVFLVMIRYTPYVKGTILFHIENKLIERMRLIFISKELIGKFILITLSTILSIKYRYRIIMIFNISYIIIWFLCPSDWFWRIRYMEFIPISLGIMVIFKFLNTFFKNTLLTVLTILFLIVFINFPFVKNYFNVPKNFGPIITTEEYNELNQFFSKHPEIKNYELFAENGLNYWITLASNIKCGEIHSKGYGDIKLTLGKIKTSFNPDKPILLISEKKSIEEYGILRSKEIWRKDDLKIEIQPFFTERLEIYFYFKDNEVLNYTISFYKYNMKIQKYLEGSCSLNSEGIGRIVLNATDLEEGKYNLRIKVYDSRKKFETTFTVMKKNRFFPFLSLPKGTLNIKYETKNFFLLELNTTNIKIDYES